MDALIWGVELGGRKGSDRFAPSFAPDYEGFFN